MHSHVVRRHYGGCFELLQGLKDQDQKELVKQSDDTAIIMQVKVRDLTRALIELHCPTYRCASR